MTEITYGFLKGVVAFVDVWSTSKTENYSSSFIKQLQDMGAEVVSKTLNKRMVVPPPGQRLRKLECKELEERVDEDLFPARYEESKLGLKNKRTHRCMQPRDIPTNTPENDRRLKKKLDKLMEGIIPPFPIALETSPFIIDEESGIVYSPSLKRSESMALRLAEMGVKSDNLSPTGKDEPSISHAGSLKFIDEQDKNIKEISNEQNIQEHKESATSPCNVIRDERKFEISKLSSRSKQGLLTTMKGLGSFGTNQNAHLEMDISVNQTSVSDNPEKLKRSVSKSLANTVHREREKTKHYMEKQTNSGRFTENEPRPQNDASKHHKNVWKSQSRASAVHLVASPGALPSTKALEDDVFEDMFSPVNNASKQAKRFSFIRSGVQLPIFDLKDSNHQSKRTRNTKRKHDEVNDKKTGTDSLHLGQCGLPKSTNFEGLEHKSPAKKQRRQSGYKPISTEISAKEFNPGKSFTAKGKKVSVTKPPESSSKIDKKQPELEAKAHPNLEDDIEKRQQDFKIVGKENKSTSDKIEQSTEMCSRNNMVKDNYTKKKRSLVMTSMPTEKQEVIYQLVRSLGGFTVVDNVCDSTSHVVSGTPRRTVNVLLGIARGCWILSYEWISRLQQHLSAGEYQQDLFQDQLPMFVSPNSQPPCSSLTELIRLCGGTVCRSVRQAGICIGGYKAKKPEGNVSISEQWILDCVTHLQILPYRNYILE
ncbi:hypothetical protein DNTS_029665 [Danionella cerebrum]|uniref:BRCT domain-containing protein n=1 Tax=Danionella cerebrum TaxID=2873325 RepID=A0A553QFN7_9TELE|nr:hypothetical protein DNTS_029665 [Danionella translucida]